MLKRSTMVIVFQAIRYFYNYLIVFINVQTIEFVVSFSTFILDLQFFTCKIGCNVYILSRSLYLSWQTYVAFLAPKYESMHQMAPNYMSWPLEKNI